MVPKKLAAKSLILIALHLLCTSWSQSNRCYSPTKQCTTWEARKFRDCLCGTKVLDYECHCQNEHTYFEPTLHQETLWCGWQCQNNGTAIFKPNGGFRCNCTRNSEEAYYGLCCELETPLCGGYRRDPRGIIETPYFGQAPYPNNRECVWKIATDEGKRIALGVKGESFSVEEGSTINTCDRDFVAVYDGESKESKLIGPFCGNTSRPFQTIHSTGKYLYIHFKSNGNVGYGGFQLEYITYRRGMRCGPRQEYSLPTAIIVSPQYPLAHKPTEDCEYEITVQPDHQLILTTLHMNLESSADCSKVDDAVIEVSKRSDPASEYQKVTRLCGKENYAPYTIRNSSHVLLRFSSGYLNEGQFRQGQFKLRYEQVPENQYFLL